MSTATAQPAPVSSTLTAEQAWASTLGTEETREQRDAGLVVYTEALTVETARIVAAAEDARLLAEVERTYAAAKGTWTGRSWDDGDKVTPETTDDQIAGMLGRGDVIEVTCWGVDESSGWRSKVRHEVRTLQRLWAQIEVCDDTFAVVCEDLRALAKESDAGVAKQAALAESTARAALRAVKLGDKSEALQLAEEAARIERQYGDAPTWGPFAEAVRAWNEHEAE